MVDPTTYPHPDRIFGLSLTYRESVEGYERSQTPHGVGKTHASPRSHVNFRPILADIHDARSGFFKRFLHPDMINASYISPQLGFVHVDSTIFPTYVVATLSHGKIVASPISTKLCLNY